MMLKTTRDNQRELKEHYKDIPKLTNKLVNQTLTQLKNDHLFIFPEIIANADDLTADQMVLRSINEDYQTGNLAGFIGYQDERLIIQSRFERSANNYFFQYLIERVFDMPNLMALNTEAQRDRLGFDLLAFLLPLYLKKALRKGLFKTYGRRQYNDSNIRGTIDVARHIRQNSPFIGNIAYNQREFSYENEVTLLIRHTIEFIRNKSYGKAVLGKISDEVATIVVATKHYEDYDRRTIITKNKENPIRHAYYREYRSLQRLCLMILQFEKQRIGGGSQQVQGILFDCAWLWEEYINQLIGPWFYHPMNKSRVGGQYLFDRGGLIYPDFISRVQEQRIIADAKYKPQGNIGNQDYLQLVAYMARFDAQQGYYIYPNHTDELVTPLHLRQGVTYEDNVSVRESVMIAKLGLKIPEVRAETDDAVGYQAFKEAMKKSEENFLTSFLK